MRTFSKRLVAALFALALSACGVTTFGLRAPTTPNDAVAQSGVAHRWESLRAPDGTELFAQCWLPPAGTVPRGVLILLHGIKDHSSRYEELATRAVRGLDFEVCGMDDRGHGRSAGDCASVGNFDVYLDDLTRYLEHVQGTFGGSPPPFFIFGHSMGGALATLLVLERHVDVRGVILSAPALRINRLPLEIGATAMLASLAPRAPVVASADEAFSRDPRVVSEMAHDPLIYDANHPAVLGGAFIDGIERVWARADTFDRPLLALHGTGDMLTDPRGSAELVRRSANRDATLHLYTGLYHDLVHEPERAQVIGDIIAWLAEHTPQTAPASAAPIPDAQTAPAP